MKIKRILSVFLCAAILLTAIPMSAFAANTGNATPYVEIKIDGKDKIKRGETTEIYIDYSLGGYEDARIVWTAAKYCEYEYVTDSETGFKVGARAKAVSVGDCWIHVKIVDSNGNVIANDSVTIKVLDSRPLGRKIKDFFEEAIASAPLLGLFTVYIVLGGISEIIFLPVYIYYGIRKLISKI